MQAQINPSLQALLQTAAMVTPEQGPTVAAKVAQAAEQKMQAQAMPPGIQALMPGVRQQAMMSAQAAQPATQGDVNQLRQMMAQQGQGVAQLPGSDVEMAEGGIVGYNGQTGSTVKSDAEDIKRALALSLGFPLSAAADILSLPVNFLRKQYAETTGKDAVSLTPVADIVRQYTQTNAPEEAAATSPTPSRPRPMSEAETARLQEANVAPSGAPIAPPAPRPPAPERMMQREPAAATVKPADAGIASLMGPPVPSGSERQFAEALAARGRMEITPERTPEQIEAERVALYRARGIDPDFAKQRMSRIEAQEARDRAEAEERAKLVKERGIENLISRLSRVQGPTLFSGLGAAQRGMEPIVAEQRRSDERFTALMRERQIAADKERTAVEDMQRALADGDIAKAEKSRNEALASRNAKNASEAEIRSKYAPYLLQAETAAQDRASRERQHELDRRAQAALRSLPTYEQLSAEKVMKDWMSKNPDKTLADAWDFYRGAGKGLEQRAEVMREKNAIARQKLLNEDMMYASTRRAYVNEKDPVKKAEALRKLKDIERLNGIEDETESGAGAQGMPSVGSVMQGYRFKGGNPADKNNWEKV